MEALTKNLSTYRDVLRVKPGEMKGAVHNINTKDTHPITSMPYRMCPAWREQIRNELQQLLQDDIIEKCNGPWSLPIIVIPVKKTDGSKCLCVDFRKLNHFTVDEDYYMPLIDVLDQVEGGKYLSKIDLTKGFYQITVKPDDRDKASFCTPWGKFKFKRMPFGF